jgi:hypothetical protein
MNTRAEIQQALSNDEAGKCGPFSKSFEWLAV